VGGGDDCFLRAEALVRRRMETTERRMRRENEAKSWRNVDMANIWKAPYYSLITEIFYVFLWIGIYIYIYIYFTMMGKWCLYL
jgi:hypothetical protein